MVSTSRSIPTEILQQIYYYLSPADFDAARNTCLAWYAASLSELLLKTMCRRAGWSSSPILSSSRSGRDVIGHLDSLLAREAMLHPQHHRNRTRRRTQLQYHHDGDKAAGSSDARTKGSLCTVPIISTTCIDLTRLDASTNPSSSHPKRSLHPTISNCARFLLLTSDNTIYIYSLVSNSLSQNSNNNGSHHSTSPTLQPITSIYDPRRVLAVSMDTSAGRYAVAALLDDRVGMVCELDEENEGESAVPPMPSPDVYARPPPTAHANGADDTESDGGGSRGYGSSLALVRYTGGFAGRFTTLDQGLHRRQAHEHAQEPRNGETSILHRHGEGGGGGGEVNTIHIRSPTQNVHLFNASMESLHERTWPATTVAAPVPVFSPSAHESMGTTRSSASTLPAPIKGGEDDEGAAQQPAQRPSPSSPPPAFSKSPPKLMSRHASSLHLYPHICSPADPPRSIAICPSRQCVAFGCAAGVELHWVSGPTRRRSGRARPRVRAREHGGDEVVGAGIDEGDEREIGHTSEASSSAVSGTPFASGNARSSPTLRTKNLAPPPRNLMKWFPLTAPSEVLAFLPWRAEIDRGNRLRLVSSVDLPRMRRGGRGAFGGDDGYGYGEEEGGDEERDGPLRGWEGVLGARGRVWRALRRWAWDWDWEGDGRAEEGQRSGNGSGNGDGDGSAVGSVLGQRLDRWAVSDWGRPRRRNERDEVRHVDANSNPETDQDGANAGPSGFGSRNANVASGEPPGIDENGDRRPEQNARTSPDDDSHPDHNDTPIYSSDDDDDEQHQSQHQDTNNTLGFDHYRALPLSDGTHLLFVDPASGDLMLGSDGVPLTFGHGHGGAFYPGGGGGARLLRKVRFVPPRACMLRTPVGGRTGHNRESKQHGRSRRNPTPSAYSASRDLRHGVRVVAAYGDVVVLYTIPPDVFADLGRVGTVGVVQFGGGGGGGGEAAGYREMVGVDDGGSVGEEDDDHISSETNRVSQDQHANVWGAWTAWWDQGSSRLSRSHSPSFSPAQTQRRWRGQSRHPSDGVADFLPLVARGVVVERFNKGIEALAVASFSPAGLGDANGDYGRGFMRKGVELDGRDPVLGKGSMNNSFRGGAVDEAVGGGHGLVIWAFGEGGRQGIVWKIGRDGRGRGRREEDDGSGVQVKRHWVRALADGSVVDGCDG